MGVKNSRLYLSRENLVGTLLFSRLRTSSIKRKPRNVQNGIILTTNQIKEQKYYKHKIALTSADSFSTQLKAIMRSGVQYIRQLASTQLDVQIYDVIHDCH